MNKTQIMLALSIAVITSLLFIPTETAPLNEIKNSSTKLNSLDNKKLSSNSHLQNDHSTHSNSESLRRIQLNKNGSGAGLSHADIARLGELFKTEEDPLVRRQIFDELIAGMTAENALEMRKYIEHLSDRSKEFKDFHRAFGAAAGLFAVEHGSETKQIDLAVTFVGWATADKDAALEWFNSLEVKSKNGMNQSFLAMAVLEGLAVNSHNEAVQFLESLDFKTNKAQAAKIIGKTVWQNAVYDGNYETAMNWTQSLQDPVLKSYSQGMIAEQLAKIDPENAAAWVDRLSSTDSNAHQAIQQTARTWAKKDSQAAVNWLAAYDPEQHNLSSSYYSTFSIWATKDPIAAGDYLATMKNSQAKDSAIGGYALKLATKAPESAMNWASQINNSKSRLKALIHTSRYAHKKDKEALQDWLKNSTLTDKEKSIVSKVNRKRKKR